MRLHLPLDILLVCNSFCLLKLSPLFFGRMPKTFSLICLCCNSIKSAAQINALVMWLGLLRSRMFVPQIIKTFFTYCGIIRSLLYSADQVFGSISLNPAVYGLFPEMTVPYISVSLESASNRVAINTKDGFLVLIRCWWCRSSSTHLGFDDLIFVVVDTLVCICLAVECDYTDPYLLVC